MTMKSMNKISTRSTKCGRRRAIAVDDDWDQLEVKAVTIDQCQTIPYSTDHGNEVKGVGPSKIWVTTGEDTKCYDVAGTEIEPDERNKDLIRHYTLGEMRDG